MALRSLMTSWRRRNWLATSSSARARILSRAPSCSARRAVARTESRPRSLQRRWCVATRLLCLAMEKKGECLTAAASPG